MVSRGMIKEKKTALKPKVKSFKVRVTRVKKIDMRKVTEDQICMKNGQKITGERFGEAKYQCDELSLETQLIVKESSPNGIQFGIMFNISGFPDGDDEMTVALSTFLTSVSDERKL